MCDYSGRLLAWMDGELGADEAAVVGQHVRVCAECRASVASYEEASRGFAAYYQAAARPAIVTRMPSKLPRWVPVVAVAAVAAAVLVVMLLPRSVKVEPAPAPRLAQVPAPVAVGTAPVETAVKRVAPVQHRHAAARRKAANTNWAMAGPAIQIAIPADEMFPPGAVPDGVSYFANVSLTNGSVQAVRLQP
jgi:Putative zinc-finger